MSFEIQQKIKQNAIEIRDYVTDLYEWEQKMELQEKTKAHLKKTEKEREAEVAKQPQPKQDEIRKPQQQQEPSKNQKKPDLIRDKNTVGDYYKAWDKFDADKQLQRLEEEAQRPYRPYNPYEDTKNNKRAKPQAKINVTGRRKQVIDPTELKDRGNLHFQCQEFQKAISCYSQCLAKLEEDAVPLEQLTSEQRKLRCVVLSNRSMAHLKNQETGKALADATLSLTFDPNYSKSYYRRAECYKRLEKYKDSLRDFRMVRRLEPTETKADAQIKKIEAFLAVRARKLRESMVMPYHENLLQGGRRVEIVEVESIAAVPAPTNYLEQL